ELFALYGAINKAQATTDLLANYKEQLLRQWANCYELGGLTPDEKELQQLRTTMETIIKTALPHCLEKYEGLDDSLAKEVQVQKQVQKQVEIERISLNDCYDPKLWEASTKSWKESATKSSASSWSNWTSLESWKNWLSGTKGFFEASKMTTPFNQFCKAPNVLPNMFSDTLRVSVNYAKTYSGQEQNINGYLKPVFLIWYHMENDQLHATIVTPQEVEELAEIIGNNPGSWICTTSDTLIAGNPPQNILKDKRYQILREQVRFFNGELDSLLNQDTPLYWLQENSVEKLTYFENALQVYRPGSEADLPQLKAALTQGYVEGFLYIAANPFEDLTQLNWKDLFPQIIPVQATEYQKVAEAFVYLNQNWATKEIKSQDIQQKFDISFSGSSYVNAHLKHLSDLKELLKYTKKKVETGQPILDDLPKETIPSITKCLGMPLDEFLERHWKLNSQSTWQIADINALRILQKYPALQDKAVIMDTFEAMVAHAIDADSLKTLLKADNPSDKLLDNILKHKFSNDASVIEGFLGLTNKLSENILISLTKKCESTQFITKLLQRKDITENVLKEVLKKSNLDQDSLLLILKQTQNPEILELVYNYAPENSAVRQEVYRHPSLSTPLVLSLIMKKLEKEELLLILQHPSAINDQVLTTLIGSKKELGEEEVLQVVKLAKDADTLMFIYNHHKTNEQVCSAIYKHDLLSSKVVLQLLATNQLSNSDLLVILEHRKAIDEAVLAEIVKKDVNVEILEKVLSHIQVTVDVMKLIIDNNAFSGDIAQKMISKFYVSHEVLEKLTRYAFEKCKANDTPDKWTNYLFQVFKKYDHLTPETREIIRAQHPLDPHLALHIVDCFGEAIADCVPLTEMIEIADDDALATLIEPDKTGRLSAEHLLAIAQKCHTQALIGHLLAKRNNNMPQPVLQVLLDKTLSYDNLHKVLDHHNLTEGARKNWFDGMQAQHKKLKKQVVHSKNPEEKLLVALEELRIKACSHAILALRDDRYEKVAKTAVNLYKELHEELTEHLKNPSNPEAFQQRCKKAIDDARPVLAEHRGYKQVLADILNVILAFPTFRFTRFGTDQWRFFQTKTESIKTVDKISENIDESTPKLNQK
ncbi:hypothetical protein, partial [Legionella brunensis]